MSYLLDANVFMSARNLHCIEQARFVLGAHV